MNEREATQALTPQEPQEKTFTVEEVREIISRISYNSYAIDNFIKVLLAEFEKAVG